VHPEPAARRSLRARLAGGPLARRVAAADLRVYRALRAHPGDPLQEPVRRVSMLGEHAAGWLALGAGGALVDDRRRAAWTRAAAGVLAAYALNTALKGVVRRQRPALADLPQLVAVPTQLSFPSAHACSSFAAARAYGRLLPPAPLYGAAAVMAWSRVYLGVHYPSDIVAGAALGAALGSAAR
jgi:undecaprenyl-diphosphatase